MFSVIFNRNPLSMRTTEPSAALVHMTTALMRDPATDVQLIPVTVLWGRSPGSQDSLVKALLADAWASVGPLRQLLIILVHGRQTRVSFTESISLRRLIGDETDAPMAAREADRFLRSHFRRLRESAIGPDLSHRRNLIDTMIASEALQEAIGEEAAAARRERRRRPRSARASSRGRSRRTSAIRSCARWSCCSGGCGTASTTRSWSITAKELAKAAPGKGLVYLPNHRSHVDYLLLSYFINAQGLAPPHIAAGANLNFPLVGPVLRRGGAFFLRRSFKGEPLYAAVFREYLHTMLAKGFPIAYFIEGGRSRSGRTLSPKGGLLGMTARKLHARASATAAARAGVLQLREAARGPHAGRRARGTAQAARIAGRARRRRAPAAARLRQRARELRRAPVAGTRILDGEAPGWQALQGDERQDAAKRLTVPLAREMAQRINSAVVINPINLFAMAIVAVRATRSTSARSRSRSSG